MGERKVLNKYIPADFDPKLVPRSEKPKDNLVPVRMMLPFSIQCSTCATFMYRGRKFNSKKEPMGGANGKYLSIQRFRFYIKCVHCSRPISFLTDPKNADYEMESGATRNYEIWHDREKSTEEMAAEDQQEEEIDPMKALENRVLDSQREMADLDNLDEIKAMNMKHLQMIGGKHTKNSLDFVENVLKHKKLEEKLDTEQDNNLNQHGLTKEEEDMVQKVEFRKKRLNKKNEIQFDLKRKYDNVALNNLHSHTDAKENDNTRPIFKIKKRRVDVKKPPETKEVKDEEGISGLFGAYGSSEDSD